MALLPEQITSPETTPLSSAFLELSMPGLLGTGVLGPRLAARSGNDYVETLADHRGRLCLRDCGRVDRA
jgi:hypothetical protein